MGRHAKVRPVSGKDKGVSCGQAAISEVLYPTTTTTSEAAGESSNTAANVTGEERRAEKG
jgi:hypothetical protein